MTKIVEEVSVVAIEVSVEIEVVDSVTVVVDSSLDGADVVTGFEGMNCKIERKTIIFIKGNRKLTCNS